MKTRSGRKYEPEVVSPPKAAEPKSTVKSTKKTAKETTVKKSGKSRQKVEKTVEKTIERTGRRGRSAKETVKEVVEETVNKENPIEVKVNKEKHQKKRNQEQIPETPAKKQKVETNQNKEPTITPIAEISEDLPPIEESTETPAKKLRVSLVPIPSIPQNSGQLYSFGDEIAGELGLRLKKVDGKKIPLNQPSIVTDEDEQHLSDIVFAICGELHSCIIRSDGQVLTFGCNDDKALGRRLETSDESIEDDDWEEELAKTPKQVSDLPPIVKLSAGDFHTCALAEDGRVFVWGNLRDESSKLGLFVNDLEGIAVPKQLELDDKIADIASGVNHILLLTEDGDVLSFGDGTIGQLGRINENDLNSIADNRELFLKPQKVDFGEQKIQNIWANHWSSYAKTTTGNIYVWGLNNYHQLGFKSHNSIETPNSDPNASQTTNKNIVELKPIKSNQMPANTVMIANGQRHMLALDDKGQVFSCGCSTYGKLGFKTNNPDMTVETPTPLDKKLFDEQKVVAIFCGSFCSFAITEAGHLFTWGQGSKHMGSEPNIDIEVPTRLSGHLASNVRFIGGSASGQHCLLIGNSVSINGNINKK